ncbi:MAG: hypothetical protein ABSF50_11310 [Burkholderiaceae bacterium]|jgi:hypothetical protein
MDQITVEVVEVATQEVLAQEELSLSQLALVGGGSGSMIFE